MKNSKKILALLLAVIMLVTCFAGCGKTEADPVEGEPVAGENNEATDPKKEEVADDDLYVIDILVAGTSIDSSLDTVIGQYIAEEFGIAFNYIGYSGDIQEKQALMLAGGDYNEIQYMQYQTIVQQYMDAGVLINLDDYKDILPDFYKRFENEIPYWRIGSPDGGLYKWEGNAPRTYSTKADHLDMVVRSDVLEYYGYPELVSASDWIAFLEQAVKDFPTTPDGQPTVGLTAPLAASWGMQGIVPIGYEKGETYVACGNDYYTYNCITEQFEDYMLNPEAKESFQFFNELYKKGILDEECFTDTSDVTQQKMDSGRAIAVWYVDWGMGAANKALTEAGHPEMSYIELPFQLDSQIGQKYSLPATYVYPFMSYGLTDKCTEPEKVLKFINWCCTEEGQLILQSGFEGVHYTVEDGVRVPTDLRKECSLNSEVALREGLADGTSTHFKGLPVVFTAAPDGQPYNLSLESAYKDEFNLNDRQKEVFAAMGWESSNDWWDENASVANAGFSQACALDTTSDLGKIGAKMVELRVKYSANLLMADDFDAVWAELMAEYDKLDHEAVINAMNATLEEHKASVG